MSSIFAFVAGRVATSAGRVNGLPGVAVRGHAAGVRDPGHGQRVEDRGQARAPVFRDRRQCCPERVTPIYRGQQLVLAAFVGEQRRVGGQRAPQLVDGRRVQEGKVGREDCDQVR
jgi:hypothetical protein